MQWSLALLLGFLACAAATSQPGTSGDPTFTGFDASTFEFNGEPYSYWNIITERQHSVNVFLTPAQCDDHVGTYITAMGFQYNIHKLAIRVEEDGTLTVDLNGQRLALGPNERAMTLRLTNSAKANAGNMTVTFEKYHPTYGQTIEIQTPMLTFVAYSIGPETMDEGGIMQPAFLDSRVTLVAPPADNYLGGILGDSYARLVAHLLEGKPLPTERFALNSETKTELKTTGLFDSTFKGSLFVGGEAVLHHRALSEEGKSAAPDTLLQYPLNAFSFGDKAP